MPRQDEAGQGADAKTKDAIARDKAGENANFPMGSTRAPTPANSGNVGLGGKTGSVTPREKAK